MIKGPLIWTKQKKRAPNTSLLLSFEQEISFNHEVYFPKEHFLFLPLE